MRGGARWAVLALTVAQTGCGFSVTYEGTHYHCAEAGECPDGFSCVDQLCVAGAEADAEADAGGGAGAGQADARPIDARFVLTTVMSSDPDIEIPDASQQGINDTVEFTDACDIVDVQIDIDITHPWRGDLVVWIISPSGTQVDLHDRDGEDNDDLIGTYPTTLTPVESLDALFGESGSGTWTLHVADVDDQDFGTLHSWAIHLWCQ